MASELLQGIAINQAAHGSATVTEHDLMRQIVSKSVVLQRVVQDKILSNLAEQDRCQYTPSGSTLQGQMPSKREQFKIAMKVWSALCKFLRSQCNKGRIIDSLFFGTFAKASAISEGPTDGELEQADWYVYCPGPKSIFKLVENRENVPDIPSAVSHCLSITFCYWLLETGWELSVV